MHVLITRPRRDADELAARLHALGHSTFIEPLIDIVARAGPPLDLSGVQALLLTSANGARAAATRTAERAILVLAVGPATAATARQLGFLNVSESGGEGVEGLARHARATLTSTKGTLLHPAGTATAGDLQASLQSAGFVVRKEVIYEARAAEALSGALTAELGAVSITASMFFSPRTAALFASLTAAAGLAPACRGIVALTLSEAVAKALAPLVFRRLLVAAQPETDAMLDLLTQA
ncbi:MAG: uroporphyrinogen-III synthase [Micropepsaceae bacterium]